MEKHPFTNEKTLTKWLSSFSCNGCNNFKNKKCTHNKAEEVEKDKQELLELAFDIEWANNIDNHFVCDYYEEIK